MLGCKKSRNVVEFQRTSAVEHLSGSPPMFWPLELLWVLSRNQLWYKPRAYLAWRKVLPLLRSSGISPRRTWLSLGLAEPDQLSAIVIFYSDSDLASFQDSPQSKELSLAFQNALARTGYPKRAIPNVSVSLNSHEAIRRAGGYYYYFK
jgi:hypothetical protein